MVEGEYNLKKKKVWSTDYVPGAPDGQPAWPEDAATPPIMCHPVL